MYLVPHHFRLLSRANVFRFVQVFCTESLIKDKAASEDLRQSTVCGLRTIPADTHMRVLQRERDVWFST